jgi:hypothetical protein
MVRYAKDEALGETGSARGVARSDGRQLDDLAVDELESLVLVEYAGLRHPLELVGREEPAGALDLSGHRFRVYLPYARLKSLCHVIAGTAGAEKSQDGHCQRINT